MMEPSLYFDPLQPKTGEIRKKKYLIWGCVGALALAVCACVVVLAGGAAFVAKFSGEPEGLAADYSLPSFVKNGETFELVINLSNNGSTDILVSDIDLDEAFDGSILDGAVVLSTEPEMEKDYSISGIKTFRYNRTIHPDEKHTIAFTMQATSVGEFGGSVGIYVGDLAKRFDYLGIVITQ
jgi:hypothetical protein